MRNSILQKSIFPFIILLFTFVLSQSSFAAKITLAWDANTESDVVGYKVYYGTSSKSYTGSMDVGNVTNCTLAGLKGGQTYYIAVTAYSTSSKESGYSSEVSGVATEPPPPVSDTPPTITGSPSSGSPTAAETTSTQTSYPSGTTQDKGSGGGG
jgi:fibronectin type 3 domain-containing protein